MTNLTSTTTIKRFYQILFDPGQTTCFSETAFGTAVYDIQNIQDIYPSYEKLMYFSVNALHTHRFDENVTCYRNFLIENDRITSIKDQIELVNKIGMPFSTALFSGSKSVHFVIALETPATSEKMYRFIGDWIHNIINDGLFDPVTGKDLRFDRMTKNPSRFTRVPGGTNVKYMKDDKDKIIFDNYGKPIIKSKTQQSILNLNGRIPDGVMDDWLLSHIQHKPAVRPDPKPLIANDVANPLLLKPWVTYLLDNGIYEGKRNNSFYEMSRSFYESGFTVDGAIQYIIDNVRNLGDFSHSEIDKAIRSGYKSIERNRE